MRSTGRGYIAAAAAKDLDEGTFCIAELAQALLSVQGLVAIRSDAHVHQHALA